MGNRIAIVLSVLLVFGAIGTAFVLLSARTAPDPRAEATAVVDGYLGAWERLDVDAMARFVRRDEQDALPEGFRGRHEQLLAALEPAEATIERDDIELEDGVADVSFDVSLELPYADTFTYDSELTATRVRGEWAVVWEPTVLHPQLRAAREFAVVRGQVDRAPILGAQGESLTGPGEVHVIGIEPRRILDEDELRAAFDVALPDAAAELDEVLARDDLVPDWFYPVATVSDSAFPDVWETLRSERGVIERSQSGRVSQGDGFALHVLGATGEVDAERLDELGPLYDEGDTVGLYGLEAALDRELTGSAEVEIVLQDDDGETVEVLHTFQDDVSGPVRTTLDVDVQQAAETAMDAVDKPAALVALDATSGAIRAAASRPLTGENRAFVSAYPPGSTFKVVTAAALLAAGATPQDDVACPERANVGGLEIGNAGDLALGSTTLAAAFANSCNTTFAPMAVELGAEPVAAMAARFGFQPLEGGLRQDAGSYGLVLPAFAGSFPAPVDSAALGAAAFGQARVEATPLHMATVAAAAANGTWRPPFLLDGEQDEDAAQQLDPDVAEGLRAMMRLVVAEGSAAEAGLPDGVAGKTGSAELGEGDATHAWFIGFRDDLAFAVFVEAGGSGGADAAPLAARFLQALDAADAA